MITRFHAYKMPNKKVAVSYGYGTAFLLIGAHNVEAFRNSLNRELEILNLTTISCLFIPEWTDVFCSASTNIKILLNELKPSHIIIPDWIKGNENCDKLKPIILQYVEEYKFADIQKLYAKDYDQPQISNNNITILIKDINKNNSLMAHRFESNGKWMTFNLFDNKLNDECLKSDIVVFPLCTSDLDDEYSQASKILAPNVCVRFYTLKKANNFWHKFWSLRYKPSYSYVVRNEDVVTMRENGNCVSIYNVDPETKLVTNEQKYYAE